MVGLRLELEINVIIQIRRMTSLTSAPRQPTETDELRVTPVEVGLIILMYIASPG